MITQSKLLVLVVKVRITSLLQLSTSESSLSDQGFSYLKNGIWSIHNVFLTIRTFENFSFTVETITDVPIPPPFAHLQPAPTPFSLAITTQLSYVYGLRIYVF